jgi:chaperonin GroES
MTTIRPLFDRVLVKRNDEPTKTASGLFIPDSASKEKPVQGTVVAVGNGRVADDGKVTPLTVKSGDKVVFGKYAGTEIKVDGEERLILREDDILGIIEG